MEIIADKYQVERVLGEGTYGKVFLVQHRDLQIKYALKLLNRKLSEDEKFIQRFKREAEILIRFTHPGSVQLRDFGRTADGLYYMTTDFCAGRLLEALLSEQGWFPVLQALDVIIQILEVVEAAHTQGIIHRDLKPSHIMVESDADGHLVARVLDFGIAKIKESLLQAEAKMTVEGFAIGTPEYMSPEQASGEANLDPRVDLYSCGVVLYELITGSVPFHGQTVLQTLLKHLTQPVPPFSERLGIPARVEQVVIKALGKERESRYQSAAEFKAACIALRTELRSAGVQHATFTAEKEVVPVAVEPAVEGQALLCLDDSEMILQIVRHIFEREGFKVFTETNFAQIHDVIFVKKVKLMLCDVQMPGLPGTKICQMLKQTTKDLKIILFSNIPERDLEKLANECQADGWLSKNSKPDEWLRRIQGLLAAS